MTRRARRRSGVSVCNELEDALDQSARDFEAMRAESER